MNVYPGHTQGLVTAYNTSSITVKIKLVCKSNHIVGLCPVIFYLLQFVSLTFMPLVTLFSFFTSAEYCFNSGLEGSLDSISFNLLCPSRTLQQCKLDQVSPASFECLQGHQFLSTFDSHSDV